MKWDKKAIGDHKEAADLLYIIKDEVFGYLKNNPGVSEFQAQEFVISRFKNYNLKSDRNRPIISFRENTSIVHYYADPAKAKRLKSESLILVDIWARLNKKGAPFADITWMGYSGNRVPEDIEKVFKIIISSRDKAINYIKAKLKKKIVPTDKEVDDVARNYIARGGFGACFLHGTGHPLGFINDHGRGVNLNTKGQGRLSKWIGYTIEPGIYIKNKFGIRSEMDFYIDEKFKLNITTAVQKKLIILKK